MRIALPFPPLPALVAVLCFLGACDERGSDSEAASYTIGDGWSGDIVLHDASAVEDAPEFEMVEQGISDSSGGIDSPPARSGAPYPSRRP